MFGFCFLTLVPFFLFVLKNIKHIGNTKFREHHLKLKNIKMVFSKTLLSNGFQKLESNNPWFLRVCSHLKNFNCFLLLGVGIRVNGSCSYCDRLYVFANIDKPEYDMNNNRVFKNRSQ